MTVPPDYAQRIYRVRRHLNLTQLELAERLGVSFASVNRWENSQTRPGRNAWRGVADLEASLGGKPDRRVGRIEEARELIRAGHEQIEKGLWIIKEQMKWLRKKKK